MNTFDEFPYTHFKILVEELSNRYKVCISISNFLDEIAETGLSLGKSLVKIGSHQFLSNNNHQWLPVCTSICESVYKMNTISNSKQVTRFCNAISNEVSKPLPENMKVYKKKLQSLSSKVITQVEEFKRLLTSHQKSIEKYIKMVHDTEIAIKNRYIAIETETKEANERNHHLSAKDDSFVNRSLTKMLSKIAPNSIRLDEKCKTLLKELDTHEKSLISNCKRLQTLRIELLNDVKRTMNDLEEIEKQRLTIVIESLSKYCVSAEQSAQQKSEMNAEISIETIRLNSDEEAMNLLEEIDNMTNKAFLMIAITENDVSKLNAIDIYEMFTKTEKLSDAMEFFKLLLIKLASALFEVAESESIYSRALQKILERHGYSKSISSPMPTPQKISSISNVKYNISGKETQKCSGFLSHYEAPLVKICWEAIITSINNCSDTSSRTAEVFCEEVCQQLDLVQQRLEIGKKELNEKLNFHHKLVENARINDQKLKAKLEKLQATLIERRNTLKLAKEKEEQTRNNMNNSIESNLNSDKEVHQTIAITITSSAAMEENEMLDNSLEDAISSPELPKENSDDIIESNNNNNNSNNNNNNVITNEVLSNPTTTVFSQSQQTKRPSLLESKLKQVVGLEKLPDRILRIEKQITNLEIEESELIITTATASQVLVSTSNTAMIEIFQIFLSTKDVISSDLGTIKKAISALMFWKNESLDVIRDLNKVSKQTFDAIDINQCLQSLKINVIDTFQENFPDHSNINVTSPLFLEIPEVEIFVPIENDTITHEKFLISQQQQKSLVDNDINSVSSSTKEESNHFELSATQANVETISNSNTDVTNNNNKNINTPNPQILPTAITPQSTTTTIDTPNELSKFGLLSEDKIIESYSCALYPNKKILSHGRLFITQHFLAFSGWPEARLLLSIADIETVTREKTLYYVPNAISIVMKDQTDYFFASFIEREQCFNLISKLSQAASSNGSAISFRKVDLGYQMRSNIFGPVPSLNNDPGKLSPIRSRGSSAAEAKTPPQQTTTSATTTANNNQNSQSIQQPVLEKAKTISYISSTLEDNKSSPDRKVVEDVPVISNEKPSDTKISSQSLDVASSLHQVPLQSTATTTTATTSTAAAVVVATTSSSSSTTAKTSTVDDKYIVPLKTEKQSVHQQQSNGYTEKVEAIKNNSSENKVKDIVKTISEEVKNKGNKNLIETAAPYDFNKLFLKSNIAILQSKEFQVNADIIWKSLWLNSVNYRDFLLYLGEIDVVYSEWVPIDSNTKLPSEDVTKLAYTHMRKVTFFHVRTTMLMFGPKNAPSNQTQYLYLPGITTKDISNIDLKTINPSNGLVLTITYFEGIPMCDVFKVCHYSSFEQQYKRTNNQNEDYSSSCIVNIGLVVHFLKNSMFKYQIQSGTKEEVTEQSMKWLVFANSTTQHYLEGIVDKDIILSDDEDEEEGLNRIEDHQNNSNDINKTNQSIRRSSRRSSKRLSISQNNNINSNSSIDSIIPIKSNNGTSVSSIDKQNIYNIYYDKKIWIFLACTFMVISIFLHRQSSTINILSSHIDKLYQEISENKILIEITNTKLDMAIKEIERLNNK